MQRDSAYVMHLKSQTHETENVTVVAQVIGSEETGFVIQRFAHVR